MTTDNPTVASPGLVCRVGAGVIGGLAGGVVFGVMMQALGMLPMVARLVDGESVLVGWGVHLAISAFVGTTYALIFGALAEVLVASAVLGVLYGAFWWVLGGLTLMPLRLGLGMFVLNSAAWQSLAGHLAYGLVLGLAYALVIPRRLGAPDRLGQLPRAAELGRHRD
ncbi:hypothetical protein [Micromonospora sp. RTP1Z1]|uniref:hypothetical protein n=1 Tax=Micromonospora sp. RTP1Z1 TaxID=2994043 RepID=UPI0029C86A44|nr:hypothetical protein [Micromonospora sp. RTP1Z1]